MKAIVRQIPNAITCLNLLSGCVGLWLAGTGAMKEAAYCVFIAAAFDFLDGTAARVLNAKSSIGKDLDSLADVISFGALPGYMLVSHLIGINTIGNSNGTTSPMTPLLLRFLPLTAFTLTVFSAIRLARFNNDKSQHTHFKGLATPANALFWAAFILAAQSYIRDMGIIVYPSPSASTAPEITWWNMIYFHDFIIYGLILIMSFLLIAPIRLMSFKVINFSLKKYTWHILLLVCSGIAAIFLGFAAAPIILALYFLCSFIYFRVNPQEA